MGSMYMCNDMLKTDLLTTSYKTFWSSNEESQPDRKGFGYGTVEMENRFNRLTDSDVVCCSTDKPTTRAQKHMVFNSGFAKLDQMTLKVLGWSSGALESCNIDDNNNMEETSEKDENMHKLSKAEFRRLSEQVRDVSLNLKNKFRTSAYQKLYQQQQQVQCIQQQLIQQQGYLPENGTQIYRSQLAASLRAFKPKDWTPLKSNETDTTFFRCKPLNCTVADRPSSRGSSPQARLHRPRSTPLPSTRPTSAFRKCDTPELRPGNYDTLTPHILANLVNTSRKGAPTFGERIVSEEDSTEEKYVKKSVTIKDDDVSTSGVDSTHSVDDSSADSSEEDDSDYEPSLDQERDVPELNLRPEKLDSLVVPDSAKGWRKFDFDANDVDIPPYEFMEPLPEPFSDIDLRQVARLKWSWRDQTKERPQDTDVEDILDRLVELERIQMETEDWEQKRYTQLLSKRTKRVMSAKQTSKDKRCCGRCLQPACTGDCPEKYVQSDTICELCRQPYCNGTCRDTKYDHRMRQPRQEDEKSVQSKPPIPRNCKTCQVKHNGKLINANNLFMGRPKSGNVTYSRGAASLKPKDLRPRPETPLNSEILRDFEKLGIEPYQSSRPTTARIQRPRSRNGTLPGKSFSSQRRDSITDVDKNVAKLNRKKAKSVKLRRPKTAL